MTDGTAVYACTHARRWVRRASGLVLTPKPPIEHGSRQEIESASEPGTNADCTEIAAVTGKNTVNPAALGHGSDRPVDKPEGKTLKFCVQLQRSGDVSWKRQFVFVACGRVEDLRDESAHRPALRSQEIVHFRKDESGYDHGGGRSQNSFVLRKARLTGWRAS